MERDVMPGVHVHADRVHVPQLIGIAVVSACVGLGLVFAVVPRAPRHEAAQPASIPASVTEPNAHATAPETQTSAATDPTATPSPEVTTQPNLAIAPDLASTSERHTLPIAPAATGSEHARSLTTARGRTEAKPHAARHFERGVVAYLRCDGLERRSKRFPCPRDRRLEAAVWRSLESLPQCRNSDPGAGQAELRLTIHRSGPMQIEMEPLLPVRGLNLRAVIKCTGPSLVKLRSRLRTPHGIVTFRFGLR